MSQKSVTSRLRTFPFQIWIDLSDKSDDISAEILWDLDLYLRRHELIYLVNRLNLMSDGRAKFQVSNGVLSYQRQVHGCKAS